MNLNNADPVLQDLLELHKKDILLSFNCHAIATIQSFDGEKQTVTATINYTKSYFQRNKDTGKYEKIEVDYPLLMDCPAIVIRGGKAGLTMPIKKDDHCLILFNDRSLDEWFKSGQKVPLESPRLHDLSDGVALVGLSHTQNSIKDYDLENPVLFNGETKITIKETKIVLENETESLNDILQDLIIAIKGIATNPVSNGSPASLSAATISNLTNIANRIGGLLE